jgi:hypothetical protein
MFIRVCNGSCECLGGCVISNDLSWSPVVFSVLTCSKRYVPDGVWESFELKRSEDTTSKYVKCVT